MSHDIVSHSKNQAGSSWTRIEYESMFIREINKKGKIITLIIDDSKIKELSMFRQRTRVMRLKEKKEYLELIETLKS